MRKKNSHWRLEPLQSTFVFEDDWSDRMDAQAYLSLYSKEGVVGCGEGVYLTLSERPADIDLQLGKACHPCSR